jgi:hypothetical protein
MNIRCGHFANFAPFLVNFTEKNLATLVLVRRFALFTIYFNNKLRTHAFLSKFQRTYLRLLKKNGESCLYWIGVLKTEHHFLLLFFNQERKLDNHLVFRVSLEGFVTVVVARVTRLGEWAVAYFGQFLEIYRNSSQFLATYFLPKYI